MEWNISPDVRSLISPEVARDHNVVPIAEEDGRLRLLCGTRCDEVALAQTAKQLEFILGRPICLVGIEEYAEFEHAFAEIVDTHYSVRTPDFVSLSAADDLLAVLLVADSQDESRAIAKELVSVGFDVEASFGISAALKKLEASTRSYHAILISPIMRNVIRKGDRRRIQALGSERIYDVEVFLQKHGRPSLTQRTPSYAAAVG